MCELATIFEFRVAKLANAECNYNDDDLDLIRGSFEDVLEEHLDDLFGYAAKLEKEEWHK